VCELSGTQGTGWRSSIAVYDIVLESICFDDLAQLEELIDHAEDYVLCEEATKLLGNPHIYCLEVRWFVIFG